MSITLEYGISCPEIGLMPYPTNTLLLSTLQPLRLITDYFELT